MHLKQSLLPLSALLGAMAMAPAAQAAPGNSHAMGGEASADIVEPAAVTNLEDLRFGTMMQPQAAGTVTVDPDGSVASTVDLSTFPGGRGPARFLVLGDRRRLFLTFLPTNITISNGTSTMRVDQFDANFGFGIISRLDTNGEYVLDVGGRLNVEANQEPGEYSGTFDITVLYL